MIVEAMATNTIIVVISPRSKNKIKIRIVLKIPNINPKIKLIGFILGFIQVAIVGIAITV